MEIPDHVLRALLAGASGALGSLWGRRKAGTAASGAVLALGCYYLVGHPTIAGDSPENYWMLPILIALGFASARLSGLHGGRRIDIPLDGRLLLALSTGFLVRGVITLSLNCL